MRRRVTRLFAAPSPAKSAVRSTRSKTAFQTCYPQRCATRPTPSSRNDGEVATHRAHYHDRLRLRGGVLLLVDHAPKLHGGGAAGDERAGGGFGAGVLDRLDSVRRRGRGRRGRRGGRDRVLTWSRV